MSGAELFLAVLGVVLPVLQTVVQAKDSSAKPTVLRAHAKNIAELHNEVGQAQYSAIYSVLQRYRDIVEPNVSEEDRLVISNLQKSIYRNIRTSQDIAQQLGRASKAERSKPEDLSALKNELGECAKYLNNDLLLLQLHLSLQQFPRLSQDGRIACVGPGEKQSESLKVTLRSDIEPIKVGYEDDPELDFPIKNGDITVLKALLDPQERTTSRRSSLALLLACRERLPKVVELCLKYCAVPTIVIGDDGLGAIHNAIGTADVVDEPPETIEILAMLIENRVEASDCDYTEERLRPLHRAAIRKNVSVTHFLLEKNPGMVNMVDAEGRTALYHACATPNQKIALVEELVNRKADFGGMARPRMTDCDGQSIIRYLDGKNVK